MGLLDRVFGKWRKKDVVTQSRAQGIDQWTAGGLALHTIVRSMVDGGDSGTMREFIRWLDVGDVVQTEHIFIVCALKSLEQSGAKLSVDSLHTTLEPQDPAGFVRCVLDDMASNRVTAQGNRPGFKNLMSLLEELREARTDELIAAKRTAVHVAQRVLAREIGVIEAARKLQWIEEEFSNNEGQVFAIFSKVPTEAAEYPEDAVRRHWSAEALARVDRKRAELEAKARPDVELACQKLIDAWAAV